VPERDWTQARRADLTNLPLLNAEELTELHLAVKQRMELLASVVANILPSASPAIRDINKQGRVLQSLDTAIMEALAVLEALRGCHCMPEQHGGAHAALCPLATQADL
jgi:hypothetical protein